MPYKEANYQQGAFNPTNIKIKITFTERFYQHSFIIVKKLGWATD